MEKRVKLSPKKLEVLENIQAQKKQLNNQFQALNEKEGLLISLVMEDEGIEKAESVKLDNGCLLFTISDKKGKKVGKEVVLQQEVSETEK